jgi:hypothetical protein
MEIEHVVGVKFGIEYEVDMEDDIGDRIWRISLGTEARSVSSAPSNPRTGESQYQISWSRSGTFPYPLSSAPANDRHEDEANQETAAPVSS